MILKTLIALIFGAFIVGGAGELNTEVTTNETGESISIIGGADGPTSIFIAGKLDDTEDGLVLVQSENDKNEIATLTYILLIWMSVCLYN